MNNFIKKPLLKPQKMKGAILKSAAVSVAELCIVCVLFAGSFSSCKDMSGIDFSNIENLYEQPLPVIKKTVQGKWKWKRICLDGTLGLISLDHTIVEITENTVIVTQEDTERFFVGNNSRTFSYCWEKMETPSGYMTYVMWDNEQKRGEWYFDSIIDDMLYVYSMNPSSEFFIDRYEFSKIK